MAITASSSRRANTQAHGPKFKAKGDTTVLLTRLELFLLQNDLDPIEVGAKAGYTPQHFRRLRKGESDATRGGILAVTGVVKKLSRRRVTAGVLFERADSFLKGPGQRLSLAHAAERKQLDALLDDVTERFADRLRATAIATETAVLYLMGAARSRLNTNPTASAIIYDAAAKLTLPDTPHALAASLAGYAFKGTANALRRLGAFEAAIRCLEAASECFIDAGYCTDEAAQVEFTHATVLVEMELWDDALPVARSAHRRFLQIGDFRRAANAELVEAIALFEQGDTDAAHTKWLRLTHVLARMRDREGLARLYVNLGAVEIRREKPAEARRWLERAFNAFRALGNAAELARTRWNMGTYVAKFEDPKRAVRVFLTAYRGFVALKMWLDAGCVGLDALDAMIDTDGPDHELKRHADSVADTFASAEQGESMKAALDQLRTITDSEDCHDRHRIVQKVRAAVLDAKANCSEISMAVAALGRAG
jgi:tetratricopeptide (TPR) repeat protein